MAFPAYELAAAGFGACIGSFLNVVIYRLPQEDPKKRSLGGRSHCPQCNVQISWRDNIPVMGWLLLRGRSRCCKQRISIRYPLVELLTAVMFVLVALRPSAHGPLLMQGAMDASLLLPAIFDATFVSFLIASSFIDWDHRILPDALNIPMMWLGPTLVAFLAPGYAGTMGSGLSPEFDSILSSGLGLAVGFGSCYAVHVLGGKLFRQDAMGFGDVKFLGAIGAFLGWQGALWTFFLGCVLGAVGGVLQQAITRDSKIPFGPFLAIGALLVMFFEPALREFVFYTWPEWQRTSPLALPIVGGASLVSLLALVLVVRRGRRNG
jgi:leader peptidase (prepilin peptidase)/N-methyltransferase